jgi:hypothetical protein
LKEIKVLASRVYPVRKNELGIATVMKEFPRPGY